MKVVELRQCRPAPKRDVQPASEMPSQGVERRQRLAAAQGPKPANAHRPSLDEQGRVAADLAQTGRKHLVLDQQCGRRSELVEVVAQESGRADDEEVDATHKPLL